MSATQQSVAVVVSAYVTYQKTRGALARLRAKRQMQAALDKLVNHLLSMERLDGNLHYLATQVALAHLKGISVNVYMRRLIRAFEKFVGVKTLGSRSSIPDKRY